jgi:hypothetical protein
VEGKKEKVWPDDGKMEEWIGFVEGVIWKSQLE